MTYKEDVASVKDKVTQLCLIISKCCRGRSGCSLVKIHIFSSALNTKENMKILEDYLLEKIPYMLVGFDPAVNRAVKYAIADKLLIQGDAFICPRKSLWK